MKKKCGCNREVINSEKSFCPSSSDRLTELTKDQQLDIVFGYFVSHWKKLGYTPIFILRLLERGWDASELREALIVLIGEDFTEIKMSEWIARLEEKGVEFPGEIGNEPPLLDILDSLVFGWVQQKSFMENVNGNEEIQH